MDDEFTKIQGPGSMVSATELHACNTCGTVVSKGMRETHMEIYHPEAQDGR